MNGNLPSSAVVRRLRAVRARRSEAPETPDSTTPIADADGRTLAEFEQDVHAVREAVFALADTAHRCFAQEPTQLHVSLQIVSNELGEIERMLDDVRAAAPSSAARAS